jgi:hypothetical protein
VPACRTAEPPLLELRHGRRAACIRVEEAAWTA